MFMTYDELQAFIKSCSRNHGVTEDHVVQVLFHPSTRINEDYTIITDCYNVWMEATKFARATCEN